jgi:RNA polymerase sigma-70 factor (ECF subfamily)
MLNEREIEIQHIKASKTNPQCFEPLYKKYYEQILKFVYKRMDNLDDTREVTSIVFSKAISNINKYKDNGHPFSSWLYRIALNEITQFYRDSKKMRAVSIEEKGLKYIAEETGGYKRELISVLKKAMQYLSEPDLLLIELRFFEERPFSEVGEIIGITENNAKVKTYRAIDKLKIIYNKIG